MDAIVEWGSHGSSRAQSVDEVRHLLTQLHSESVRDGTQPFIAEVTVDQVGSIALGIGRETSILIFTGWEGAAPYLISRGKPGATNTLVFHYGGQWSEYPGTAEIAFDVALDAVCEFVGSGAVPATIDWDG